MRTSGDEVVAVVEDDEGEEELLLLAEGDALLRAEQAFCESDIERSKVQLLLQTGWRVKRPHVPLSSSVTFACHWSSSPCLSSLAEAAPR